MKEKESYKFDAATFCAKTQERQICLHKNKTSPNLRKLTFCILENVE